MSRRRLRRRTRKQQRHAPPTVRPSDLRVVVREATRVERLAYTRTQAAQALGISTSTFNRRVLPYLETVETGSGRRLVPVDELERFLAERRQQARTERSRLRVLAASRVSHPRSSRASAMSARWGRASGRSRESSLPTVSGPRRVVVSGGRQRYGRFSSVKVPRAIRASDEAPRRSMVDARVTV